MAGSTGPNIVEDGLVFAVDAANKKSYPGSGTAWADLSGNGYDGTLTNGPTFDSGNNGSIVFDGLDDQVQLGSINSSNLLSFFGVTSMTVMFWVYPQNSGDPYQRVVDKSNSGNGANGWAVSVGHNPNTTKRVLFMINGVFGINYFGTEYEFNAWNHMTFTKDGSTHKYYLNGELITTNTISTTFPSTTTDMRIGTWNHSTGREFKGELSNVRMYNRVLTAAEVAQNYNQIKSRFI